MEEIKTIQSPEAQAQQMEQALNVIVAYVKLAVKRGAFELEELEKLIQAINTFPKADK